MKTLVLAALVSAAVLPAGRQPSAIDGTWRAQLQDNWTRNDNRQWINLRLDRDDDRQFGFSIPLDELGRIPQRAR